MDNERSCTEDTSIVQGITEREVKQTPCFPHLQNLCKSGPVNIVHVDRRHKVQLLDEALLWGEDAYTVDDQRLLWSFHWGCHDPCHLYSLEKLKLNRIEVYTFLSTKDVTLVGVK